jgi:GNAT superfamily N-acetyltransferase
MIARVSPPADLVVATAVEHDRRWIGDRLTERWHSTEIVSRGRLVDARGLPAVVARTGGERVGLATYRLDERECELVTLDSFLPGAGVGSALLARVAEIAREHGCARMWLTTTNDNISALRFYQRRGLRLVAVHRDAIRQARLLKPSVPELGADGIPIRDELELELPLRFDG